MCNDIQSVHYDNLTILRQSIVPRAGEPILSSVGENLSKDLPVLLPQIIASAVPTSSNIAENGT